MRTAQLAKIPVDARRSERRMVNLAASLRETGAEIANILVLNLSTEGFMAETDMALEPGNAVWLKLSGLEPQNCKVVWAEEGKAGFEFAHPLHPATLELLTAAERKLPPRRHFGPQSD